jgi:hypothetical protein
VRAWKILLPLALLVAAVQLWRGHALSWDEVEFFRATKWIGEGRVPFRDFWEHHLPLQWVFFAPIARLFARGPGAGSILVMRIAQLPLWIGIFAMLLAMLRRELLGSWSRWAALVLLLGSPLFLNAALEYRVDTLGNFGYIAALAVAFRAGGRWQWPAFGLLMSAAVLANMRLAPLVVATGALMLLWSAEERRWRWSPRALLMTAGIAPIVALFAGWLFLTGDWPAFIDAVIGYNRTSNDMISEVAKGVLWPTLLAPLSTNDVAAVAMWLLAIGGCVLALREVRRPGVMQIFACLAIFSVVSVALTGVQYPYHFQNAYLLMLPLVTLVLHRAAESARNRTWQALTVLIAAVAVAISAIPLFDAELGDAMRYQDTVMKEVDRRTAEHDVVWDGVGYALRREPAYRYWFLPAGVRLMAASGSIEPYSTRDLATNPPAAILYGMRMKFWLELFPPTARWSFHHYVPLYRDLWIPALGTIIEARPMRVAWRAPAAGRYEIFASEVLSHHPWLTRPAEYLEMDGPTAARMQIPLRSLTPLPQDVFRWTVDGREVPPGTRILTLAKGSRVELLSTAKVRAGVLVVPVGVTTLCKPAPARFIL